ncbi:MAG TPA: HAMP domain-containing sensor histidine kinase, partial [Deinococcales bacterium]|nr:HAMP domain-containing sensor histidine kinase [Deinococcales bacterium]
DEVAELALSTLSGAMSVSFLAVLQASGRHLTATRYYGQLPGGLQASLDAGFDAGEGNFPRALAGEPQYEERTSSPSLAAAGVTGTAKVPFPAASPQHGSLLLAGRTGGVLPWSASERRLLEAAVRSIALAFERVRFTTRLAEQKAELESRNQEQETFIYTVSHDLRAPLLSIQGMATLLRDAVNQDDPGEVEFLLERIDRNVATMGSLIGDLLQLSRVGRMVEDASLVNVGEVLETVLTELKPRVEACGALIDVPLEWPEVMYPRSEVYQLLSNTLGNAVKFSCGTKPQPRIAVSWTREAHWVTLRVSDNGPGIAEAQRTRVFDLFRKLDVKSEGTGVGLAIVKRIVERHGGKVWVEDSPLGGASFAFTLPAYTE